LKNPSIADDCFSNSPTLPLGKDIMDGAMHFGPIPFWSNAFWAYCTDLPSLPMASPGRPIKPTPSKDARPHKLVHVENSEASKKCWVYSIHTAVQMTVHFPRETFSVSAQRKPLIKFWSVPGNSYLQLVAPATHFFVTLSSFLKMQTKFLDKQCVVSCASVKFYPKICQNVTFVKKRRHM
jgi:hypothetical protein